MEDAELEELKSEPKQEDKKTDDVPKSEPAKPELKDAKEEKTDGKAQATSTPQPTGAQQPASPMKAAQAQAPSLDTAGKSSPTKVAEAKKTEEKKA